MEGIIRKAGVNCEGISHYLKYKRILNVITLAGIQRERNELVYIRNTYDILNRVQIME